MNKKIISVVMILTLAITINVNAFAAPSTNETSELKQAQSSKRALQIKVNNFNNKIDEVLNKIDINKTKMNEISQDIKKTQSKLEIVEKSAIDQEDLFEKRARVMYINGVDSYLEVLLDSTSFSDLISRADTLKMIIEYDKNIIAKIEKQRNSIIEHRDTLNNENNKLSVLKANNEIILTKLSKDINENKVLLSNATKKETKLIADKKAKEFDAAKIIKEQAAIKRFTMSRHLDSSKSSTSKDVSNSTNYFIIESTAYSLGGFTSSGSRTNRDPNGYSTIAVDPRVIPIGSKVYVEGYGYAIASDTGSAIKGNIIDVFFNTEAEVLNWGRRNVKIRIIN
ncbi:3D domain-containing protein [Clostridium sp.]